MKLPRPLRAIAQPFRRETPMAAAPPTPAPEPPPVAQPPNAEDEELLPPDVGLRDSVASGQYNNKTGELYPGFAISAEDIVVDVGCGDGDKAHFCAQRGAAIIFVDSDPGQVGLAGKRLAGSRARSLTPVVSDADPLPLESGIATRVIASEVIEHVDDPVVFLRELVRVGRPGALYLLTVPDPVCEGMQKKLAPPIHFQKPNHIRIIQRDEFVRMATDAGLEIVSQGSHGFYWAMWLLMFWSCKVDISVANQHPLLANWSTTWSALLDTDDGLRVKQAFDEFMPISQYLVARKPLEGSA